ncbi:CdaR family transcriptional regulator [Streptomyces sp. ISL-86]|uniref:PucR family transcriptional regulator n=1 Tax=Streptomyces sp. ISL-86 TaxID=2819187 RepID=UPI001BEA279D|nr:helix-turn-helix domain-containing protein [Streptomyces sp. ISL-86]MBT2457803.1 helix-turn-helix domain-containing protein [Streptomyces sp. ISL-86]
MLPGAAALWDVLDQMTDAAAEAYRLAEAAHGDRERERRAALLDALLDGTGPVPEAAAQLGLPELGRFAVVVLGSGGSGGSGSSGGSRISGSPGSPGSPGSSTRTGAGPAAPRVLWRIRADGETGLVDLGHHPLESVRELLAPLGVRAGISPVVETAADLPRARRLAALALRTAPASDGPRTALLDERLPAALVAAQTELSDRLRQVVLGPVLALPAVDRRVLLTTLGTWLACQGSTTYAAERLYCHRNTVSNRLRRLEQLTGRSLTDPAHVVELALAHAAVVQRAAATPPGQPGQPGPPGQPLSTPSPPSPIPASTVRRSPRSPA